MNKLDHYDDTTMETVSIRPEKISPEDGSPSEVTPSGETAEISSAAPIKIMGGGPKISTISEMVRINTATDIARITGDMSNPGAVENFDTLMKTRSQHAKRLYAEMGVLDGKAEKKAEEGKETEAVALFAEGREKQASYEAVMKQIRERAKEILDIHLKAKSIKNAEIRELDRKIMHIYDYIAAASSEGGGSH